MGATAQLAYCDEADLTACTAGSWNVFERSVDIIETFVDEEMTFLNRECVVSEDSANSDDDGDDAMVTWIAVALVAALVLFGVAMIVIVRRRRPKVEVGFEEKDEIEVEMDAD